MYEVMRYWDTAPVTPAQPDHIRDFAAIWQAAEKVVYSRTLDEAGTARTRIERSFDPDAVRRLKDSAERDLGVGGPELAGQALRAGLVDECQLFLTPMIVGGGTPSLPAGLRVRLELLDERRFDGGFVYLRYRIAS
jgi:dihydrofolate reductase